MRRMPMTIMVAAFCLMLAPAALLAQFDATPPDFLAPLAGDQEVPPHVTPAMGQAQFRLINDGQTLVYRLIVDDISNVTASHIHLAAKGVNGSVVAILFHGSAASGPISGIIAEGTIESADLIGPLAGQDLSVLVEAMRSGGAYVNVHTDDGVAPTNTGPGDFPGGEIRGQIQRARDRNPRLQPSEPQVQ